MNVLICYSGTACKFAGFTVTHLHILSLIYGRNFVDIPSDNRNQDHSQKKLQIRQVCIPVGCVSPAAVAGGGGGGGGWGGGGLGGGGVGGGGEGEWGGLCDREHPHPPWTDTCKSITFPQLRLRAVINAKEKQ